MNVKVIAAKLKNLKLRTKLSIFISIAWLVLISINFIGNLNDHIRDKPAALTANTLNEIKRAKEACEISNQRSSNSNSSYGWYDRSVTPECEEANKLGALKWRNEYWESLHERYIEDYIQSIIIGLALIWAAPYIYKLVRYILRLAKSHSSFFVPKLDTKEKRLALVRSCIGLFIGLLGLLFLMARSSSLEASDFFGEESIICALLFWSGIGLGLYNAILVYTPLASWINNGRSPNSTK